MLLSAAFFIVLHAEAQTPRPFAKLNGFISKELNNNFYPQIDLGLELFSIPFFAPEVSYSYFAAQTDEIVILTSPNPSRIQINSWVKGSLITLTPKIAIPLEEWTLYFLPNYSFGKATADSRRESLVNDDVNFERVTYAERVRFFSFGVGFEKDLTEKISWGGQLMYTQNNSGRILENIEFNDPELGLKGINLETIGFGVVVYYDLF
ncbi:hypothetical protein [Robertkochia sediminum]|uniref:hypothetical protein n=1 Tax=Robertkochia sediminum TaxID=2785326 RepID=UPI0019332DF2|nr:hypothetical protein [Robertkochia sediminum]MBL7471446.1 hypothetical protein [Robertkochia sediminum]